MNIKSGQQKIEEKGMQIEVLKQNIDNYNSLLSKQEEESKKKKESNERSEKKFNKLVKDKNINLENRTLEWKLNLIMKN